MDSPAKQEVVSLATPKDEKRERKALLSFTDAEWTLIEQAAGKYPPATWMRVVVVDAAEMELAARKKDKP